MKDDLQKGYGLMAGVLLSFTTSAITVDFVSRHYENISPFESIFWGWWGAVLIAAPFYFGSSQLRKRMKKELQTHSKLLVGTSLVTLFAGMLWFWSVFNSTSGMVALLAQAETVFAFLLGVLFLKERVNSKEILGLLVAIGGFFVISNIRGEIDLFTALVVLFSSFLYASQSFLVKRFGGKIDSIAYSYLRTIIMSSLLSIYLLNFHSINVIPLTPFLILTGGQIAGFIIGRILYFQAHKHLPISTLNTLLLFDPVLILIFSFFLFGDAITAQKVLGSTLIISGLLYFSREKMRLRKETPE